MYLRHHRSFLQVLSPYTSRRPSHGHAAELIFNQVVRYYGIPEDIVSAEAHNSFPSLESLLLTPRCDRKPLLRVIIRSRWADRAQKSRMWDASCEPLPWPPERLNQFLGWAEYAQNSLRQSSTGLTPFQCGTRFPAPPVSMVRGTIRRPRGRLLVSERARESWDSTHHQLQQAVRRQRIAADVRRSASPEYQPGQKVWLSTRDIKLRLPCRKLSPRFVGPFTILEQINPVTYNFSYPTTTGFTQPSTYHCLNPSLPSIPPEPWPDRGAPSPSPPGRRSHLTHRVEDILESRRRGGKLEYLVDWEGMVPRNILGSPERTFWTQHSLRNFTRLTPIVQLPGVGVDLHDAGVGPQERAVERGALSTERQALPSVNHYDPNHLNSNHEHLHLITTVIKTTIRAPATVHPPSDLVSHYVDSTPAYS